MLSAEDRAALILGKQIHKNCALEAQLEEVIKHREQLLKQVHELEGENPEDEQPEAPPADRIAETPKRKSAPRRRRNG